MVATIFTVALPHIHDALHFSGTNLKWVVNAQDVCGYSPVKSVFLDCSYSGAYPC